jgi:hypothetical protein
MIRTTLLQHESFEKVCQSLRLFERETVSTILEDLGDDNVGCSCSHLFFHKGPEESASIRISCLVVGQRTYSGAPTVITLHFTLPLSKISCSTSMLTQWLLYVSNMPLSPPGAFEHLTHSFTAICSSALGL